jgi:hypothetical protein
MGLELGEHPAKLNMLLTRRSLLILLTLLACVAAILLYPTKTVIVPAWRIRVVDEVGKPVSNEFVRQSWKHYSLELDAAEHLGDGWTDADGYVAFPERSIRANLLQRILVPLVNTVSLYEHASYGVSAEITVWGGHTVPTSVKYTPDRPLPAEVVLPGGGG